MKKILSCLVVMILLITLGIGLVKALEAAIETKGHLLWDGVDQVWRCLGSPKDCVFVK